MSLSELRPLGGRGPVGRVEIPTIRPLIGAEEGVNEIAKGNLVDQADIETKATDSPREVRSSIPTAIGSSSTLAIVPVALKSIHEKWPRLQKLIIPLGEAGLEQLIACARERIAEIKTMYESLQAKEPEIEMRKEIRNLLNSDRKLVAVASGTGGVYFLSDEKGETRFVIKPGDEAALTLHNPKKSASPYVETDNMVNPRPGVKAYEMVQNAEIASKTAEILGIPEVTPKTEMMIIDYPLFHDVFDGTTEGVNRAPKMRAKVCSVQPFITGFKDLGTDMSDRAPKPDLADEVGKKKYGVSEAELHRMLKENPDLLGELVPTFDPELFEKIALFLFITGEKDGNLGNWMLSQAELEIREVLKIDNGASFPDDNIEISTGLHWAAYNTAECFSAEMIRDIQSEEFDGKIEEIKHFMKSRGKSDESVQALQERVDLLKKLAPKHNFFEIDEIYSGEADIELDEESEKVLK